MLGIAAYAVLGSADFGAGFWDLTAGGARRGGRLRGNDPALDGARLGGQPRLADLRPGDRLDRVPESVRLDLLDALHPAVPGRDRDHLPRHRVRAARAGGDDQRGARARRPVRERRRC